MTFQTTIEEALREYDRRKGIWRRLFGDAPVIKKLRKLDLKKVDELGVLTCFIVKMPKESQASYRVYKDIFSFINIKEVTKCLKVLHQSKLLTQENLTTAKEHNNPSGLAIVLSVLKRANLLMQGNFNAIKKHDHIVLSQFLRLLKETNLLTQENFTAVKEHSYPSKLVEILSTLKETNLLTQENFTAVKEHSYPSKLVEILSTLKETNLLTQENFTAVKEHKNSSGLVMALSKLKETNLLTQENFTVFKEYKYPVELSQVLSKLREANLLTEQNINAFKEHENSSDLVMALSELKKINLLTQENINLVKEHKKPSDLVKALSELKKINLLTQENINLVKEHKKPSDLVKALSELKKINLSTEKNINAAKKHSSPYALVKALSKLEEVNLLTQEYFNAITEHKNPSVLVDVLLMLEEVNLSTQENFTAVKEHSNLSGLVKVLSKLKEANLLIQENFTAVKEHSNLSGLVKVLSKLEEANLLIQKNFTAVKEHSNLSGLVKALSKLEDANLLIQENFTQLLEPNINILLTLRIERWGNNHLWDIIPTDFLTQETFEELIRFASLPDPIHRIEQFLLLLVNGGERINNIQSTHTASIHQTVSTSALKLMSRYKDKLPENKVEEIISTIKDDISKLPTDILINKAAKNCIERISQLDFTDPYSKITVKQLLALSYLARHDDDNRQGCKEDANQLFIEGLYEIQRGYNITANGVDSQGKDKPICSAGTFNKLMEKLCGVHPDVELNFITKEIAAQKLPIIVYEEAKNYLEKLSKYETKEDFHSFITLLKQLLKEGIEIIWNEIKPKVTDRLFDEFKSIYNSNKENSDFLGLVNAGQDVELKADLINAYQQPIEALAESRSGRILQNTRGFFQVSAEQNDFSQMSEDEEPVRSQSKSL